MWQDSVRDEVSNWVDNDVIAEELLDDLVENGIEPTVENAQKLWLNVLETELHQAIQNSINYAPEFN